jgi:hypothetical protein
MSVTKFQVVEAKVRGQVGYQIHALYRDCSDSFWEPIAFAAIFPSRARAEAFLKNKIMKKNPWDLDWSQWGVPVMNGLSVTCAIQGHTPAYSVI